MLTVLIICLLVRTGSSTKVSHIFEAFVKVPVAIFCFLVSLSDLS